VEDLRISYEKAMDYGELTCGLLSCQQREGVLFGPGPNSNIGPPYQLLLSGGLRERNSER
jgi:hypothetical protein